MVDLNLKNDSRDKKLLFIKEQFEIRKLLTTPSFVRKFEKFDDFIPIHCVLFIEIELLSLKKITEINSESARKSLNSQCCQINISY